MVARVDPRKEDVLRIPRRARRHSERVERCPVSGRPPIGDFLGSKCL